MLRNGWRQGEGVRDGERTCCVVLGSGEGDSAVQAAGDSHSHFLRSGCFGICRPLTLSLINQIHLSCLLSCTAACLDAQVWDHDSHDELTFSVVAVNFTLELRAKTTEERSQVCFVNPLPSLLRTCTLLHNWSTLCLEPPHLLLLSCIAFCRVSYSAPSSVGVCYMLSGQLQRPHACRSPGH